MENTDFLVQLATVGVAMTGALATYIVQCGKNNKRGAVKKPPGSRSNKSLKTAKSKRSAKGGRSKNKSKRSARVSSRASSRPSARSAKKRASSKRTKKSKRATGSKSSKRSKRSKSSSIAAIPQKSGKSGERRQTNGGEEVESRCSSRRWIGTKEGDHRQNGHGTPHRSTTTTLRNQWWAYARFCPQSQERTLRVEGQMFGQRCLSCESRLRDC
ncbi:hypothetical protein M3Y94_00470900 [Aphelenchoides besseyi]|nr:hypothetical protein M3Y94_00470900 [Aphelenchoides besseyi]